MDEMNVTFKLVINTANIISVIVETHSLMCEYDFTINQTQLFANEHEEDGACLHYATRTDKGVVDVWINVDEEHNTECRITTDDNAEYALLLYNRLKRLGF